MEEGSSSLLKKTGVGGGPRFILERLSAQVLHTAPTPSTILECESKPPLQIGQETWESLPGSIWFRKQKIEETRAQQHHNRSGRRRGWGVGRKKRRQTMRGWTIHVRR